MKTFFRRVRPLLAAGALALLSFSALRAAAADEAAPELALSLRGLVDDSLEQGEPLRVVVRLEASSEGAGRVELAPATGTWAEAIAVELLSAESNAVIARAVPVGVPNAPRAVLDREHVAGGLWMFSERATQGLALGDYVVRARLSIQGSAGWSGQVTAEDVPLTIVGLSDAPERVSARTLVRAQLAFSAGAFEEAARLLDAVLAKTPDELELLCLRADVALAGGNRPAAIICVSRAARSLSTKAVGPPPLMLDDVQTRVLAAQPAAASSAAAPPAWTWPPLSVRTLPEQEMRALREMALPGGAAPSSLSPVVAASAPGPVSAGTAMLATNPAASVPSAPSPTTPPASSPASPGRSDGRSIGSIVAAAELNDAQIRSDAAGQWAATARAGSQYGQPQYSPAKATGAPDVTVAGNSPDAWCPATKDTGTDWLEVSFAKPIQAVEVRVRQNDAPGAITKIEAIASDGTTHVWWEGVDPYQAPAVREIVWFAVRVPKTPYLVARVKLTLDLASRPGWKEIDAVQLVSAAP